jgi:hypothetical protein
MKKLFVVLLLLPFHAIVEAQNLGVQTGGQTPIEALQIGGIPNTSNHKLFIPGVYNFEQVRLGQYGNGAGALEFVNHMNVSDAYGMRLLANSDLMPGLHFQYAPSGSSYNALSYTTGMFMGVNGNVGIGTTLPQAPLHIAGGNGNTVLLEKNNNVPALAFKGTSNYAVIEGGDYLNFYTNGTSRFWINLDGNIGINTTTPTEKLSVNGNIRSKKIIVSASPWPDYVFDSSYKLTPLHQLEKYIEQNKHLPDMPSMAVVSKEGIDVGDNQAMLLKKIEELTLYIINQEKRIKQLEEKIKL